jgi:hypothetical protein
MAHKERRHEAIIRLSSRYLLEVATQSDKVSHAVFLVRRENVADLQTTIVQPITHSVRQLLKTKLMKEDWKDQSVAYGHLATHPQMRQLAGQVFESMAQLRLQKQVVLDLVPMTRQPASGRSKAKWIMTPRATAASSLTAPNVHDAANTPISIKFTPEGVEVYTGPTPANILPNIFYLPKSLNQPAFDSFILADEVLYIFQFSIASEHEINPSMMDFFPHAMLREAPWCFIFVVPPDKTLEFPEPSGDDGEKLKEFWKRTIPFTTEFDPSKHTRPELGGRTSAQSPSTPATLLKQTPQSQTKRKAEDASPAQDLARINGNKRRDLQA